MNALDEIRGRLEAATPGPWRWDEEFGARGDTGLALTNEAGAEIVGAYNHHCCSFRDDPDVGENDAEFIAHAPADVAALLRVADAALAVAESCEWRASQNQRNIESGIYDEAMTESAKHVSSFASVTAEKLRSAIIAALEGKV